MLCVIAKIDDDSRMRLERLKRLCVEFDMLSGDLYGHITLATYIGERERDYIAHCKTKLNRQSAFNVNYTQIEALTETSIIVASPEKRGELNKIQQSLTRGVENQLDEWTQPDIWKPHTTLMYSPIADLCAIASKLRAMFEPFTARVARIEFSKVTRFGYDIIDCQILI